MRRSYYIAVPAIVALTGSLAFMRTTRLSSEEPADPRVPIAGTSSDLVSVREEKSGAIDIVIGPVHLSAHNNGYRAPIQLVQIPVTGWVRGFSWFVHDAAGNRLSDDLLHHVNLIDPDRRELFAPVARRVIAMGRETEGAVLPGILGYPLHDNTRFLVVTMFSNPTPRDENIFLTIRLEHTPPDRWLKPLPIFPFHMDVMGPVGEKDFPVPPGHTIRSWEGSPAVDARILGVGGHLHDFASLLKLEDLTTGRTLWSTVPVADGDRVTGVPRSMSWKRGGIRLRSDHRYRVTVEYNNSGTTPTPHGGMGVVGGMVLSTKKWPPLDRSHRDYVTDLQNVLSAPLREDGGHGMSHH